MRFDIIYVWLVNTTIQTFHFIFIFVCWRFLVKTADAAAVLVDISYNVAFIRGLDAH